MDLISLAILIIVVGVLLWAVNTYIPMQPAVKQILNVVVCIALVIFIISLYHGYIPSIHVGKP